MVLGSPPKYSSIEIQALRIRQPLGRVAAATAISLGRFTTRSFRTRSVRDTANSHSLCRIAPSSSRVDGYR